MEIEIYLPCDPDWFCDSLLILFTVLFTLGLLAFVWIVFREHRRMNEPVKKRKGKKSNNQLTLKGMSFLP